VSSLKNIYKVTNTIAIMLSTLVASILLFDNVTSNYSQYFRILNLIIFCIFLGFSFWLFKVQREIVKLYKIPKNKPFMNKLSLLFSLFDLFASFFLSTLAYAFIDRLYTTPLLG